MESEVKSWVSHSHLWFLPKSMSVPHLSHLQFTLHTCYCGLSLPQTLVILLMAHSAHITHLALPRKLLLPNIHACAYNLSSTLPMLVYHSYFSEKKISWTLLLVIKSNDNSNVFLLPSTHSDSSHIFWSMLLDMEVGSLFVDIRIQAQRLLVALPRFHKNVMLPMRRKSSISDL